MEAPPNDMEFFIGVTTYAHIQRERLSFRATATLCKLILFDLPRYCGTTWQQLSGVPLSEMLVFLDEYPNFIGPARTPPPPYYIRNLSSAPPASTSPSITMFPPTPSAPTRPRCHRHRPYIPARIPPFVFDDDLTTQTEAELNSAFLSTPL